MPPTKPWVTAVISDPISAVLLTAFASSNSVTSWLRDSGRVTYVPATDKEALAAFQLLTRIEGIIPALEPAHALARVGDVAKELGKDGLIIMNMCGRGDKDIFAVAGHLGLKI